MEREIRFRAKEVSSNNWVFGDLIQYENGDAAIFNKKMTKYGYEATQICMRTKVESETIGQFTGKHDKNRKEIYSGDLLRDQDGVIYEIWYSEETAAFMSEIVHPANDMVDILGGYDTERCFEVIGNIFDNKELLED